MSQQPNLNQQYKDIVLAELKKQLTSEEFLSIKPLVRNANDNNAVFELAKKYAKDLNAIRKESISIKPETTKEEFEKQYAEYSKISDFVRELGKLTGYWLIGSQTDEMVKYIEEKGITVSQLEEIMAPVRAADADMDKAIDEALAKAQALGIPHTKRSDMGLSSSMKTRDDYQFGGKEGGSLFSKAQLEGDFCYDLTITCKKDKESSRNYNQLKQMELRGLINVNEETWAKIHTFDGGKHTDGDYKYEWTKTTAYDKVGNDAFKVSESKDSSKKEPKK